MKQLLRLCGAAALAMAAGPAFAAPSYTANVIFGDSLSDNGNVADALGHDFPNPPFYHDSFTNGKTAIEVMDDLLGLSTNPSLFPTGGKNVYGLNLTAGTNYSVAGSTAGNTYGVQMANLPYQVGAYLASVTNKASAANLYTFFIGGNDVRDAAHMGNAGLVASGAAAELGAISQVIAAGGTNILVVNVPNIGVIPETLLKYPTTAGLATQDTLDYNNYLLNGITLANGTVLPGVNALKTKAGLNVTYFDLFGFQKDLLANPGAYGLTDTTSPCYVSYGGANTAYTPPVTSTACGAIDPVTGQPSNIAKLAFWDAIHPTETVDKAIGLALYQTVAGVPEPSTWTTMLAGFGLLGAGLRRRRSRRAGGVLAAA